MKRGNHDTIGGGGCSGGEHTPPAAAAMGKGKAMMEEDDQGEDELLAALGYKVRSSDLAGVAQKLEQLEMAMANPDDGLISHLASDTVHYNPSDISNWLETMLAELNSPPPPLPLPQPHQPINTLDLAPTPPSSTITAHNPETSRKRMRADSSSSSAITTDASSEAPPPLPVAVADPQQAGVRLIHALMACAEAVQAENMSAADALMTQISILAPSQGGAMRKVAVYFAEALARRIYRVGPERDCGLDDALHMHFYDSAPYLKFAHFTANQAILEAFAGCRRVHVIDFGMRQGMQWPALMQALALRPCGPPSFRLTGIGPPQSDNTDALQQVGWKLAQFADAIHVDFEYRGFVASSLADLEPYMLESAAGEEPEAVAINSVFELHRLLNRPGALDKVLKTVKAVRPRIVTVVEQEGNHNARQFMERFTEAMHYYSTMFDSMEAPPEQPQPPSQDRVMAEVYMGRQICNVVACEGAERTERHETLAQWRGRMGSAGFEPVHLGSNAYKQASTLLALFAGGDGYRVEENEGCLTLGWHTRPLIATSAWRAAAR